MTDAEWGRVVELLAANWSSPNQLQSEGALRKMREDLASFPGEQVLVAVETIYRDGESWPPNGGKILNRLADLTFDFPDWYEALRLIRRALHKAEDRMVNDDSDQGWHYEDERMTWLQAESPFVAAFVKRLGIRQVSLQDGNDEARLRDKYRDFVRKAQRTVLYSGLPAAGLPALERAVAADLAELAPPSPATRQIDVPGMGPRSIELEQDTTRKLNFSTVSDRGREAA